MSEAVGIGLADVLRVLAALALVSGLTVGLGWLARSRSRRRGGAGLRVEERLTVSRTAQLLVVRVEGRKLLIGASDKGVQLVTELDAEPDAVEDPVVTATGDDPARTALPQLGPFARLLAGKLGARGGAS
jgi:flagellar biogenesis protein FliO